MKWFSAESGPNITTAASLSVVRVWFEALVLFFVIALFGIYLFKPQYDRYSAASRELDAVSARKNLLMTQQQKLRQLAAELKTKQADADKLDKLLPSNTSPSTLYYLVEQLALNSGLVGVSTIVDVDPKEITTDQVVGLGGPNLSLKALHAQVRGGGSIDQLQGLVKLVESAPRFLEVTNVEITSAQSGQIAFAIDLDAYAYGTAPVSNK